MGIQAIGVDMAEIDRIAQTIARHGERFVKRIFTAAEIAYCAPKAGAESFAARFAAKEAVFKAVGTGLRDGMCWHDVAVVNSPLGKPELRLSGKTAEMLAGRKVHLSISHSGNFAIAMVVVEAPG